MPSTLVERPLPVSYKREDSIAIPHAILSVYTPFLYEEYQITSATGIHKGVPVGPAALRLLTR